MIRHLIKFSFIILFILSSCSTGYQPRGFKGGYSDRQITKGTFFVSFKGNGYTNKGDVLIFFLLRCAEIAKINGEKYFAIQSSSLADQTNSIYVPGASNSTTTGQIYTIKSSGQTYGNYKTTTTTSPGYNINIKKPYMEGTIKLLSDVTSNQTGVYSVEEIFSLHGHHLSK